MPVHLEYAAGWTLCGAASAIQRRSRNVDFRSAWLNERSEFAIIRRRPRNPRMYYSLHCSCFQPAHFVRPFSHRLPRKASSRDDELDSLGLLNEFAESHHNTLNDLSSMIRKRGTGESHQRPVAAREILRAQNKRAVAEARAQEERATAEARAQEERAAAEARAQQERAAAEARAQQERAAAEARAQQERAAAEGQARAQRRNQWLRRLLSIETTLCSLEEEYSALVARFEDSKINFRERFLRVAIAAHALESGYPKLVSEYCHLKHLPLLRKLDRCAGRNYRLEREYRQLKRSLQITVLEYRISTFSESFRQLLEELNEEFIRPRDSARRKVRKLIASEISLQKKYLRLQSLFRSISIKSQEINGILYSLPLSRHRVSRERLVELRKKYRQLSSDVGQVAHQFRKAYLANKTSEGVFSAAWVFSLFNTYGFAMHSDRISSTTLLKSIEALLALGIKHKKGLRRLQMNDRWTFMRLTQYFYLRRLEQPYPSRSPKLNIYWRQLDVMAPFELHWAKSTVISQEIEYLIRSFNQPDLWTKLNHNDYRNRYASIFKHAQIKFHYLRGDISREYRWLKIFNWLRLRTESELHGMGETAFTVSTRLFTPRRPLSQDLRHFNHWLSEINKSIDYSISLERILGELKSANPVTSVVNSDDHREADETDDTTMRQSMSDYHLLASVSEPRIHKPRSISRTAESRTRSLVRKNSSRHPSSSPAARRVVNRMKPMFSFKQLAKPSMRTSGRRFLENISVVRQPRQASHNTSGRQQRYGEESLGSIFTPSPTPSTSGSGKSRIRTNTDPRPRRSSRRGSAVTPIKKDRSPSSVTSRDRSLSDQAKRASQTHHHLAASLAGSSKLNFSHSDRRSYNPFQDGTNTSSRDYGVLTKHPRAYSKQNHQNPSASSPDRTLQERHDGNKKGSFTERSDQETIQNTVRQESQRPQQSVNPVKGNLRSGYLSTLLPNSRSRQYSTEREVRGDNSTHAGPENGFSCVANLSLNCDSPSSHPSKMTKVKHLTLDGLASTDSASDHDVTDLISKKNNVLDQTPVARFWSHKLCQTSEGKSIHVHYCKSLESAERVASQFLESGVVGFDIEWKAQASSKDGIKNNLSLIQLANDERIALFHIALFRPGRTTDELVPPSLKKVLESSEITKVGVSIRADCTRMRRHLGIGVQSQLELSHLYKLVKFSRINPKLINKRVINLSLQVEEHLGLPLNKDNDVRCSDWSRPLNYDQVHYAAADPFACLRLYRIMEEKREALDPVPPRPAHAELELPILLANGEAISVREYFQKLEETQVPTGALTGH